MKNGMGRTFSCIKKRNIAGDDLHLIPKKEADVGDGSQGYNLGTNFFIFYLFFIYLFYNLNLCSFIKK
jgi:hypothetical protein